ncbi:MAG TPA: T9SS type A sorting domain-containing protein [Candidatus Eisenbacteria bacterium]|jgi:hypothetical protein
MSRRPLFLLLLPLTPLFCALPDAWSWTENGVQLFPDSQPVPILSAQYPRLVSDGAGGAIIVWDRWNGTYIKRVLASGELDSRWPVDGLRLWPRSSGEVGVPISVVTDGAGGAIASFGTLHNSGSHYQRLKRVLPTGVLDAGWPSEGVVAAFQIEIKSTVMTSDGFGGALLAWGDCRDAPCWNGPYANAIYAQRVLAAGMPDPSWPPQGLLVCSAPGDQTEPFILADGSGGAFIAWLDYRDGNSVIYVHHVLASGQVNPSWPSNGRALTRGCCVQMVSDGSSGVLVAWSSLPGISAQHIMSSGEFDPNWPAAGCTLTTTTRAMELHGMITDDVGGAIVTWHDVGVYVVYVQRVLATGRRDPAWPGNGLRISNLATASEIATDGRGGGFVTWADIRHSGNDDIYVQHVLPTGQTDPAWPTGGVAMCAAPGDQADPAIIADGVGGAIVIWVDQREPFGSGAPAYAQRVDSEGTPVLVSLVAAHAVDGRVHLEWQVAGQTSDFVIMRRSRNTDWEDLALAVVDGLGRIVFDDGSVELGDRYAYGLRRGLSRAPEPSSVVWIDVPFQPKLSLRLSPNPSNGELLVSFSLPRAGRVILDVLDLTGRTLASRSIDGLGAGSHAVPLAPSFAPGVYVVRMTTKESAITARAAIVR